MYRDTPPTFIAYTAMQDEYDQILTWPNLDVVDFALLDALDDALLRAESTNPGWEISS